MWTSTLDLDPRRVLLARLLGRFWRGAYFSSYAPLSVQNLPRQALPSSTWVRVRNRLAGICGSDLHLIYADGDLRIAPAALSSHRRSYPGHEVVGEVIEIGDDVRQLRVGDRVVLQYGPNCVAMSAYPPCRFCARGDYNLCERGPLPGPDPIGGGWSEEMLLPAQQLYRLSATMSDEQAVMLEPTAVALHAVLRRLPQVGERILIIGAGNIGLLTLQTLRLLAPQSEISVLARHPFQVEQATRLGAAHIIYPQDSYIGIQRAIGAQLYRGLPGNKVLLGGYDVIYDTIGQRKTLHHALRWASIRASLVLVGISLHMMHIDLTPLWYHEISLLGSLSHGLETWPLGSDRSRTTFSMAEEMMERGELHPEQLITHRFALDNYQHALLTAAGKRKSRAIKVVFDYALMPPSAVPNLRASAQQRRPTTVTLANPSHDHPASSSEFGPLGSRKITSPATPRPSVPLTPVFAGNERFALEDEDDQDDTVKVPIITLSEPSVSTPANTPDISQQPTSSIIAENHGVAEPLLTVIEEDIPASTDIQAETETMPSVPLTPEDVEDVPTQPVNQAALTTTDDVISHLNDEEDASSIEPQLPAPVYAEMDSPAPLENVSIHEEAVPMGEPEIMAYPETAIAEDTAAPVTSSVDDLPETPVEISSTEPETAVQQDMQALLYQQNGDTASPAARDEERRADEVEQDLSAKEQAHVSAESEKTTVVPRQTRSRSRKYNRKGP